MELQTPAETLYRIILRAREYEAQVPGDFDDGDDAANIDGDSDDGDMLAVLDDEANSSVEEELRAILEDLGDDQIAEVLALSLIGDGSYEPSEWSDALDDAAQVNDKIETLVEMPMFASTLEAGLAAFDVSVDGFGESV